MSAQPQFETGTLQLRRRITMLAVVMLAGLALVALISRGPAILLDLSGLATPLWCF